MGMYTEFHFNAELKEKTPKEIIEILQFMVNKDREHPPEKLPEHPLFETERWSWMLTCDSYYFDAKTESSLTFDDISGSYYLNIRCNLKNYSAEIEKFIDWIDPHLDKISGDFLGFKRYEETEQPTLIFKK